MSRPNSRLTTPMRVVWHDLRLNPSVRWEDLPDYVQAFWRTAEEVLAQLHQGCTEETKNTGT